MCECNKHTSPPSLSSTSPSPSDAPQIKSIMKNNTKKTRTDSNSSLKPKPPRRRNRTKTRKPKYLSLRLQLSKSKTSQQQQPQLNLFPLHPENQNDDVEEDKDDMQEDQNDVVLLFSSDTGATSSLHGLLDEADSTTTTTATGVTTTSEEDSFSPPPPVTYPIGGDNGSNWLVRKAMRRKEGDVGSEEIRWVCYSEVVEKKELMEEVTSFSTSGSGGGRGGVRFDGLRSKTASFRSLSLKLDYEGILNAWSDKGAFYVAAEAPQTVPDLVDDFFSQNHVAWDGCGSSDLGNTWKVPEGCGANKMMKVKEENQEMVGKLGHREASVLRYKEKRQSRLFSKRIRYEVRKLNAEKRPRMKGRFVKRD